MSDASQSTVRTRWVGVTWLLLPLLIAGGCYLYFNYVVRCIDGCGPYHNRTKTVDLDGDGDLDVVFSGLRHETETIVWAGATLWINQGGGEFTSRGGEFGGPYTTAGDVDGDGDVDLLRWDHDTIRIHINYGESDPTYGGFRVWYGIRPVEDPSDRSVTANGSIALGDLNGDGRLDAIVSSWGADLIKKHDDYLPYLPWVWINTPDENGYPKRAGLNLNSLGDLPMQPALGDLDGDGDLDVYAASLPPKRGNYDSADRILLNDGSGIFSDSGQRLDNPRKAGSAGSGAVSLGDLDGDGDLDALVATAKEASIWMNQGGAQGGQTGVFAESGQRLDRGHVEAVFLADLDANGALDAIVAGKAQATIWWNDGPGDFRDSGQRLKYTKRHGLAVGDFDSDGDLDIFSAAGDEFQLWLNQGDGRLREHELVVAASTPVPFLSLTPLTPAPFTPMVVITSTPACDTHTASVDLSAFPENLRVGDALIVTVKLNNEGCVGLGLPQYRLNTHSDGANPLFEPVDPEPVVHSLRVAPEQSDTTDFNLKVVASGQTTLTASVSFEVHLGYPGPAYWGSSSGEALRVIVAP